ncbi:MAG: acyltransferase [Alkalinema sp. CACIAM 70d]|nr:MAG: acyltransferase [Alkalinema sp. CACIAM 70d]
MTRSPVQRDLRLPWLEGIRIFAAVFLLLYHAQLLLTHYAYTPQPTGLLDNWQRMTTAVTPLGTGVWTWLWSLPIWFGYQFVDVFVLISGFSLVLSLKGRPIEPGSFIRQRFLRILWPFWTVAWLGYPILWAIGTLTHSYIPDPWHIFAGLTFPLLFDYGGLLLLSTNGPWWFVPLILSFALVFPLLWHLMHRWGVKNVLIASIAVTLGYRFLATYVLEGHPTYAMVSADAGWQPFLTFVAKLSTFVVGMIVGIYHQRGKGAVYWSNGKALLIGLPVYVLGFVGQFYRSGWITNEFFIAIGLSLICMVAFRSLLKVVNCNRLLSSLGRHSYSYYLIHNFIVDRTMHLYVGDNVNRYYQALPGMILGTLSLAMLVDWVTPKFQQGATGLWHWLDRWLRNSPKDWTPQVGDPVIYQEQEDWSILQLEQVRRDPSLYLCCIARGGESLWVNVQDLKPATMAGKPFSV